ncbi:MAG: FAD-binding oxidoreductase, partial [Bacteroidales bacterium]|nr:FAD-binding oxidoreductase [Bacteroidales bacterium]
MYNIFFNTFVIVGFLLFTFCYICWIIKKSNQIEQSKLDQLRARIDGELFTDRLRLLMYATDASDYREVPMAVVYPQHESDIRELVRFARENRISLIPRAAGTSLAGQVVGSGMVVDVSRHMNSILEINEQERWVRVQPGVIIDELNIALRSTGLFFSPETSTSNRSMIGGMIGNNSSGLRSLVHGATRDHTLTVRAVLSDASVTEFGPLNSDEFNEKLDKEGL